MSEQIMSEQMMRNLEELMNSIRDNTAKVEERVGKSGAAIAPGAAKYYEALERLAKE